MQSRPHTPSRTGRTVPPAIDLVILDLDGTILDLYAAGPIRPAVRAAIAAVQDAGIPVTLATGRTLDYVRAHVADLGITLPVVTGQGAVIGDPQRGVVLEEVTIAAEAAQQAAAWIDAHDYVAAVYFGAGDMHPAGEGSDEQGSDDQSSVPTIRIYQNRPGRDVDSDVDSDVDFYDHVFGLPRTVAASFAKLVTDMPTTPLKFIVAETSEQAAAEQSGGARLDEVLQAALGQELTVTRTHPRLVEATAVGVDKGAGVRRLCARLGIDPARVLAIGDSDNDIPMLQAVGWGVGMGNASPGVRAVADWLAPSIEQDGAAVALHKWVLGR